MPTRVALLLLLLLSSLRGAESAPGEAEALLRWKASLLPPGPGASADDALASWSLNGTGATAACSWRGVSCDSRGRVVGVDVAGAGLAGTLDALDLASLPSLSSLNLSSNALTGTFFFRSSNVSVPLLSFKSIDLSNNNLSGPIPATLPMVMPNLEHLNLSSNQFTGSIPPALANLTRLQSLVLGSNLLVGGVPPALGAISGLKTLELGNNPLGGTIPAALGKLRSLERVNVSLAQLGSTIPTELSLCTNITVLALAGNKLSGELPPSLARLTRVREFNVSKNMLTGAIRPEYFTSWTRLTVFQADHNRFTGEIPAVALTTASRLQFLSLATNNLSGVIPPQIGRMARLEVLDLSENGFSGAIPRTIGNLTKLHTLRLYDNKLTGRLPEEFGNMTALERLSINTNMLEGELPAGLTRLPNLLGIVAFDNRFSGAIPREFGRNISILTMSNNRFSGGLPPGLCNTPRLRYLALEDNDISGTVPACYRNFTKLVRFRMAGNRLSGDVSEVFGSSHPDLNYVTLSGNAFHGELPGHWSRFKSLAYLHLEGNMITGTIPASYGGMVALQDLSLASNRLVGTVPPELGGLPLLINLDLSGNMLEGGIPVTLGNAKGMLRLDLSGNRLQCGVPVELTRLSHMWHLNLSRNNLTGEVPALLGKMEALQELDLSGNPGLCGQIPGLRPCSLDSSTVSAGRSKRSTVKLVITLASVLLVCIVAVSCVVLARINRRHQTGKDTSGYTTGSGSETTTQLTASIWSKDAEFTFGDILAATEHFNDAYCIGKGSFGSVYRADLPTGPRLAVKRLDATESGDACWGASERSFENEVRALTLVRHRNIVKLHGFCASAGHMYLAYELVERGSLGKVLYGGSRERFDWAARVRAVRGVAHALAYLHHDCSPPMVHRDVSVNNVLLGPDFEPRVSDFGTARFLDPGRSECASVAGSYGYMAPEMAYMRVTTKCDVYSFGVVAMEILMGQYPGGLISSLHARLPSGDQRLLLKDAVDQRLDPPAGHLAGQVVLAFIVALSCVRADPDARPTMRHVEQELSARRRTSLDRPFAVIRIGDLTTSDS
ncbi:hypothetical protein QOZ80_2BG0182910 [Eleusine coracana subsp. coracana]|nr:hypothetical protein QOZ80_2BG0182910 [Eleusine coracana subsp. coracana]